MAAKEKTPKTEEVVATAPDSDLPLVEKVNSRAEVQGVLDTIARKTVESNSTSMHSMILLDRLLRLPNADELFDKDLKEQAKDLWLKLKSTGIQLSDPPFLFGGPVKTDGVRQEAV